MASPAAHRVSYYYDTDVGNFYYAQGHPMKPYRVRMTHNLLLSYGMLDRMDILVRFVVVKMCWLSASSSCHYWFCLCVLSTPLLTCIGRLTSWSSTVWSRVHDGGVSSWSSAYALLCHCFLWTCCLTYRRPRVRRSGT